MANEPREDARHHSATRKCGPQPREAPLHARQTVGTGCRRRGGGGREAGAPGATGGSVHPHGPCAATAGPGSATEEETPRGAAERATPRSRPQTGGAARRGTAGLPAARVGAGLTPDCATALNSARSLKPSPCALNQEACGAYEISVKLGDPVLGGGRAPQAFWASAAASWTKRSHSVCRVPLDACVEHPRSPG